MQVNQLRWLRIGLQQWVLAFCLLMSCMAIAVKAQTSLVSINQSDTGSGNNDSRPKSGITSDGRFVVFTSEANNLTSEVSDTNYDQDIFIRDLATGTTKLVSINSAGTGSGNKFSDWPSVSADGRYVVFQSYASDLVPGDTNDTIDIFVRDMMTGTTQLISINSTGTGSGDDDSLWANITPDGRWVIFQSEATDLVAGITDTNRTQDIFVRDLATGTTTLISVNNSGNATANNLSYNSSITPDGRFVVFQSGASDLVSSDANDKIDVFIRDLTTGITKLISVNNSGTASSNGHSGWPSITPDGKFVAFASGASDLVPGDTNAAFDAFVRDMSSGTTKLVSVNAAGTTGGNAGSGSVTGSNIAITPDGRFVVFQSWATDMIAGVADTYSGPDIFVRDLIKGITTLVTATPTGTFSTTRYASSSRFIPTSPSITPDGRYIVFESDSTDLVEGITDTNLGPWSSFGTDIFVRDLLTGRTTLISVNSAGLATGNGESGSPHITPDGQLVIFQSLASDLVSGDTNGWEDVFIASPCPTMVIPNSISVGAVGVPYRQSFVGVGARGDLTFQLTGSLPAGLFFTSDGVLSGTATAAGNFSFTVSVLHRTGCSASRSYALQIFPPPTITPDTLPDATFCWTKTSCTRPYAKKLNAIGSLAPYTFSLVSGSGRLPPGLTLSSIGWISGAPLAEGVFSFKVRVVDALGGKSIKSYTLFVLPPDGPPSPEDPPPFPPKE